MKHFVVKVYLPHRDNSFPSTHLIKDLSVGLPVEEFRDRIRDRRLAPTDVEKFFQPNSDWFRSESSESRKSLQLCSPVHLIFCFILSQTNYQSSVYNLPDGINVRDQIYRDFLKYRLVDNSPLLFWKKKMIRLFQYFCILQLISVASVLPSLKYVPPARMILFRFIPS